MRQAVGISAKAFWARMALAAAVLGIDAVSKTLANGWLSARGVVWLWRPWLSLELVHNAGATLGMLAGHPGLLAVVAAASLPLLVALARRTQRGGLGLALMLGGAAGNLMSRLQSGVVTDFMHLWFWPGVFNAADVGLRVGALLLVAAVLRVPRRGTGPTWG